ncbi:uncharacterized protein TNCV_4308571 [Trichonephila clavipes]|nr:uncharacterized protein TNCV_4308571 [Trichonephila clavipes]
MLPSDLQPFDYEPVQPFANRVSDNSCRLTGIMKLNEQLTDVSEETHLLQSPYQTHCTDYLKTWRENGGTGPINQMGIVQKCRADMYNELWGCVPLNVDYPHTYSICRNDFKNLTVSIEECTDLVDNYNQPCDGNGPLTPAGLLKLVKRFEETGKLEDRARAGRLCLKEARAPCIAVEMEAIASEAASGTSSAREAARRLAYHHHLSVIFVVESSSCTHTNCNRAMNFCQQIPHRGKHLRNGPSLKWNRIPPGFLTPCGQTKLIFRFMMTLTTITVAFERSLIHVNTHRSHCIPRK